MHVRAEDLAASLALLFGLVHCYVRVAQQCTGLGVGTFAYRDTHACANSYLSSFEIDRRFYSFDNSLSDTDSIVNVREAVEQNCELVSPETGCGISGSQTGFEATRYLVQ